MTEKHRPNEGGWEQEKTEEARLEKWRQELCDQLNDEFQQQAGDQAQSLQENFESAVYSLAEDVEREMREITNIPAAILTPHHSEQIRKRIVGEWIEKQK